MHIYQTFLHYIMHIIYNINPKCIYIQQICELYGSPLYLHQTYQKYKGVVKNDVWSLGSNNQYKLIESPNEYFKTCWYHFKHGIRGIGV